MPTCQSCKQNFDRKQAKHVCSNCFACRGCEVYLCPECNAEVIVYQPENPFAKEMDEIGFWAMEVWGGATFDTMHRFLDEDPWERPKTLKKYIKKTPFSMLLRGQNLVGYRNYADDVVRAFVDKSCEVGIDIFRVFDALNDLRNFQTCVEVIKKNGKHFQGAICFSLT